MRERLTQIVEQAVAACDLEFVGIEYIPRNNRALLIVYIDKPEGVTLDDCAEASRQIGGVLDVEDVIPTAYELQVSSPGLERPLFTLAHYQRFLGEQVHIQLHQLIENRRRIKGRLTEVNHDIVSVDENGKRYDIPFEAIRKANLVFEEPVSQHGRNNVNKVGKGHGER